MNIILFFLVQQRVKRESIVDSILKILFKVSVKYLYAVWKIFPPKLDIQLQGYTYMHKMFSVFMFEHVCRREDFMALTKPARISK